MSTPLTTLPSDVVLIGGGIMSATLGVLLKELDPTLRIDVFERLEGPARESSGAWNNAGTGHAALCELNYTPEKDDGSIDVTKALKIGEQFEQTKQFWSHLIRTGFLGDPSGFIHSVPHVSFVRGDADVAYLRKRYEALSSHPLFAGMEFTEDPAEIGRWAPLVMDGREAGARVAATRSFLGTDVDFGALTRALLARLDALAGVHVWLSHEVDDLRRTRDGGWTVTVTDRTSQTKHAWSAPFVFVGAGGGALELLDRSDIPEARGYGGFPVGGQWLRCTNPAIVARHQAKVYGKADEGSPPMSVPHLDTRVIQGEKALLFGPFAGFSTKFLKNGSWLDLPMSIEPDNLVPMVHAGLDNIDLTQYLVEQVLQSREERVEALRAYMPSARLEDWELVVAGQRVQIIKRSEEHGGVLEFGTEVVSAADGSLAALLGASPGASTAVAAMLRVIERCMPERFGSDAWTSRLAKMVPSYAQPLGEDHDRLRALRAETHAILGLIPPE